MHNFVNRNRNVLNLRLFLIFCVDFYFVDIKILGIIVSEEGRKEELLKLKVLAYQAGPLLEPLRRVLEAGFFKAVPSKPLIIFVRQRGIAHRFVYQVVAVNECVVALHYCEHLLIISQIQILPLTILGAAEADGLLPLLL